MQEITKPIINTNKIIVVGFIESESLFTCPRLVSLRSDEEVVVVVVRFVHQLLLLRREGLVFDHI